MPFESDELVVMVAKPLADDDEDHDDEDEKEYQAELDELEELDALALTDAELLLDW